MAKCFRRVLAVLCIASTTFLAFGGRVMAYSVKQVDFKGATAYVLRDEATGQEAMVLPSIGANCISYAMKRGDETVQLLFVPPDPETLQGRPSGYGIPILFPWPNRIEKGTFTFDDQTVRLESATRGAHVLHGFVLNRPWKVKGFGASGSDAWITCTFASADFEEISRQWPFPFEAEVTYRLKDGTLAVEMTGSNPGPGDLPCGIGFHPYFPLPLEESGDRDACTVELPCETYWPLHEDNIPTGEVKPVGGAYDLRTATPLAGRFYDDVWSGVTVVDGWSRCVFEDPNAGVRIAVEADSAFREWVLYAPESRPVVCFEPYTCTTNAHNMVGKEPDGGLVVLKPGETLRGVMRFRPEAIRR